MIQQHQGHSFDKKNESPLKVVQEVGNDAFSEEHDDENYEYEYIDGTEEEEVVEHSPSPIARSPQSQKSEKDQKSFSLPPIHEGSLQ